MREAKPDKRFPKLIKTRMFEMGINRDEMAVYLHMSVSTYNRRINHNPEEFTIGNLKVFSSKLKIDKASLIDAMM